MLATMAKPSETHNTNATQNQTYNPFCAAGDQKRATRTATPLTQQQRIGILCAGLELNCGYRVFSEITPTD